jgi:hypothetical protein
MKKVFKIISSILIISFFIIGAIPNQGKNMDNFNLLGSKLMEINGFSQNGIRAEYSTKKELNQEYEFIKNKFIEVFGENINQEDNIISYADGSKEVKAIIWNKNGTSNIRIDYLNNEKNMDVIEIKEKVAEIVNIKTKKVKYFSFIKLKLISEKISSTKEVITNNLGNVEVIRVENGYVGKAVLKNNVKVNIGYMKYDTGEYLIIGTPVIFVTY